MQIILFRHGIAEDQSPDGADESRRLTAEGQRKTRKAAKGLGRLIDRPRRILTSPKVRAAQTAAILGRALDVEPTVRDVLAGEDINAMVRELRLLTDERIVLVGHEPSFSRLAEKLCTGKASGFIDLKKAGCICLDWSDGQGPATLLWLVTPGILSAQ